MAQNIINDLTTIILSILFKLDRWVTNEMHSNSPPKFPMATASGRPLNAHTAVVVEGLLQVVVLMNEAFPFDSILCHGVHLFSSLDD